MSRTTFTFRLLRYAAIVLLLAAIGWLIGHHHEYGMKGLALPIEDVVACAVLALTSAILCKRFWLLLAAPFVAGVLGAFACGPYGGVLGLLIGLAIILVPFGHRPQSVTPPSSSQQGDR